MATETPTPDVLDVGGVKHLVWEPGDGYPYHVVLTPLPRAFEGGDPETHVLVSVFTPWAYGRCYIFPADEAPYPSYVAEKLDIESQDHAERVARAIALAMGVGE